MGMKANSGFFSGTLGTTHIDAINFGTTYTDRNIEIPDHIKKNLDKLKRKGDFITGNRNDFSEKDVSVMSKETGVEFAKVTVNGKSYLIRGDKNGAVVPESLISKMKKHGGTLDFHTHPHDDDCVPSNADRNIVKILKTTTGQTTSQIVTPNGRVITFNENGVIETGSVSNRIDRSTKEMYLKLFGGD